MEIKKRDGLVVPFNSAKISEAISKAAGAANINLEELALCNLTSEVVKKVTATNTTPTVEEVQDAVERVLTENNLYEVVKKYILYRANRNAYREKGSRLMRKFKELNAVDSDSLDQKRENGNIDGNTSMGTMLQIGCESFKEFSHKFVLTSKVSTAHLNGDIHIHDLDFYNLTTTCCHIDLKRLFKYGFSTGHGTLRTPNGIQSGTSLSAIAIQANQNDQHGGQSIPMFDYYLAPYVAKTFITEFCKILEILFDTDIKELKNVLKGFLEENKGQILNETGKNFVKELFVSFPGSDFEKIWIKTLKATERQTFQAMEAFIHNLNTMHSRAGSQVPFSSVNLGTDISEEGRMVIRNFLLATEAGLGNGETPIFPISIFKVKEGVNYNKTDPNYDLFQLAMRCSAKRLFPNFAFVDAPFNLQYYKPGRPETEIAYMGCRTRVISNVYDPDNEVVTGRGNLSYTSINLPRLAILSNGDIQKFYELLDEKLLLVTEQILQRFEIQGKRKMKNFPFLVGQGVWHGGEKLRPNDTCEEIFKQGTLSIGFIGLAETLTSLIGKHHGESPEAQKLGLEIVGHMRNYTDSLAQKMKLNWSIIATPAEGLSGRFVKMDKERFGNIPGVTDKEWYTNSFHVPVEYQISAFDKIHLEAPYHALTNAGHISYIEMNGDPLNNLEAFEAVVRCMKEAGIGYGAINHPVDRDPVCGYTGIINDVCPVCGRHEHEAISESHVSQVTGKRSVFFPDADGLVGDTVPFERIRRITGYLTGTLDRFNDAKRAECLHRQKHM